MAAPEHPIERTEAQAAFERRAVQAAIDQLRPLVGVPLRGQGYQRAIAILQGLTPDIPETDDTQDEPWWFRKPPRVTTIGSYYPAHAIFHGPTEITDGQNKATVFTKVFDPEGTVVPQDVTWLQKMWSEDVPHQTAIREIYKKDNPGEPAPVLYSARTVNQDGYPTIIQEMAPPDSVGTVFGNEALTVNERRQVYFTGFRAYTQYALAALKHGLEYGEQTGDYRGFGDQKFSDLRWDPLTQRLVVLDVHSMRGRELDNKQELESGGRWWLGVTEFIDLTARERSYLQTLLNDQEKRLLHLISLKTSTKRRLKQGDAKEHLALLRDFASQTLTEDDPRLKLSSEEQKMATQLEWRGTIPRQLYVVFSNLSAGEYTTTKDRLEAEIPKIQDARLKDMAVLLLLLADLRTKDYKPGMGYDKVEADIRIFEKAMIGVTKLVAGEWDNQSFEGDEEFKQALLEQIKRCQNLSSAGDNGIRDLLSQVRQAFPALLRP